MKQEFECTFHSVFPHQVNSDGIQFASVRGLFPGGEIIDFAGNRYRAIQVGPSFSSRLDAEVWFGQEHTLNEWNSIGLELCCGVKCKIQLDVHTVSIGQLYPFYDQWEVTGEDCWTNPDTGEEECFPIEEPTGATGIAWSINGGELQFCELGNWMTAPSDYDWKAAALPCIAAVNNSWSALNNDMSSWPVERTDTVNASKGNAGTFSYYNYYGDWYDVHHWRNKRYGWLYVERPDDLPVNSKTGVILKLTVRFRMYDFSNNSWGVWAYVHQDEEVSMTWGTKHFMPKCDNVPACYECGPEDWWDICPKDGWEKRCAECEISYEVLRYI